LLYLNRAAGWLGVISEGKSKAIKACAGRSGDNRAAMAAPLAQAGRPHVFKAAAPMPADPLEELLRVVNEAQKRDAEDERRLTMHLN